MIEKIYTEKGCEVLASSIREQILSGKMRSGDMLPNERELVDRSGLSRGSVREAMRILETQGLISTSVGRNQGRRAISPNQNVVRNSIDLFIRGRRISFSSLMETFETLAPDICALAATNHTEADIAALEECQENLKITLGAKRFVQANLEWHLAIGRASHNPLLSAIYAGLGPSLTDPHVAGFTSKEVRIAARGAVDRIQDSILARDADAARRKMLSHVQTYRRMVEPIAPRTVVLKPTDPS
jgi:GntR family transcriptional repressor for pyruvate dehydrogenase complex